MDNTRLEKINALGNKIAEKKIIEMKSNQETLTSLIEQIESLTPRIKNLCTLAQAMLSNNISLGRKIKQMIGFRFEFETDHIDHVLGFYLSSTQFENRFNGRVTGFGIGGGGWDGHDLVIDTEGSIVAGTGMECVYDKRKPEIGKMRKLLKEFDSFEKSFLSYIDSVTE